MLFIYINCNISIEIYHRTHAILLNSQRSTKRGKRPCSSKCLIVTIAKQSRRGKKSFKNIIIQFTVAHLSCSGSNRQRLLVCSLECMQWMRFIHRVHPPPPPPPSPLNLINCLPVCERAHNALLLCGLVFIVSFNMKIINFDAGENC